MSEFPEALEAAIQTALSERLFCSNCGGPANGDACEYCDRGLILRAAIRAYGEQEVAAAVAAFKERVLDEIPPESDPNYRNCSEAICRLIAALPADRSALDRMLADAALAERLKANEWFGVAVKQNEAAAAEAALRWAFMNQPQPGWTVTTTNESTTYTANEDIVGYATRGLAALGFK